MHFRGFSPINASVKVNNSDALLHSAQN